MERPKHERIVKHFLFTYKDKEVSVTNAHHDGSIEKLEKDMISIVFCNIEEQNVFTEDELDEIASMNITQMYNHLELE